MATVDPDAPTPKPGTLPAAKPAARPRTPNRAAPKKSNAARNILGTVVGLGGAIAVLHFLGVPLWPRGEEMVGPSAKEGAKAEAPKEKPAEAAKPKVERPVEPAKPREPEKKPEEPKAAPADPAPDLSKEPAYAVKKVLNGSQIVVKGPSKDITVTLLGVKTAKPGDPKIHGVPDGQASLERLKSLVGGKKVQLYYGITDSATSRALRDQYGVDSAWVFLESDGTCVNLELVRDGHARYDSTGAKEFEAAMLYWDERASR